jgi:hypothetical protein
MGEYVFMDKQFVCPGLDGATINPKVTYSLVRGQKEQDEESSDTLTSALFPEKSNKVISSDDVVYNLLVCKLCCQFNLEAVRCNKCTMPACKPCFDSHFKKQRSCPTGCPFPVGTKIGSARRPDRSLRLALLAMSVEATTRMDTMASVHWEADLIGIEEYNRIRKQLKEKEGELEDSIFQAKRLEEEGSDRMLDTRVIC